MALTITLHLPTDVERTLRADVPDLEHDAREAYAVDLYRRGRVTRAQVGEILGLDRIAVDGVLRRHEVYDGSPTAADIEADVAVLDHLLGPGR